MPMTKKQRKRAATAGAVVMMLGVLHLSTKDASGTEACGTDVYGTAIPCKPGQTPPTTITYTWTPPATVGGGAILPPPIEGHPQEGTITVPTLPGPPTLPPAVTTTTEAIQEDNGDPPQRIEEDDPRWDCKTMGNKRCGPVAVATTPTRKKKVALATGCRDEQYVDGTHEVICDTNGELPADIPLMFFLVENPPNVDLTS